MRVLNVFNQECPRESVSEQVEVPTYHIGLRFSRSGHKDRVLKLLVSDKYIFSSSSDNTCKLWRVEEEEEDEDIEICLRTFEVSVSPHF